MDRNFFFPSYIQAMSTAEPVYPFSKGYFLYCKCHLLFRGAPMYGRRIMCNWPAACTMKPTGSSLCPMFLMLALAMRRLKMFLAFAAPTRLKLLPYLHQP